VKLNEVARETASPSSTDYSKTSERFYWATLRHIPEDGNFPKNRNFYTHGD
jgi:hypothetical protein